MSDMLIRMNSASTARAADQVPVWTVWIFSLAICYQLFHWIEHTIQVYQHAILGIITSHSHGALFFLDLEWNHFVFNFVYLISLISVFFGGRWYTPERYRTYPTIALFLGLSAAVEGWHFIEHSVRIYQHVQAGCEPCAGVLGPWIDIIYLHGTYNTLTLILPITAFIAGGFHARFWRLL